MTRPVSDAQSKPDSVCVPWDRWPSGGAAPGAALPYIAAWHQAPTGRADRDAEALGKPGLESGGDRALFGAHLQVFSVQRAPGKLKYLAGTESGMGVWINDIEPETAARTLREAM